MKPHPGKFKTVVQQHRRKSGNTKNCRLPNTTVAASFNQDTAIKGSLQHTVEQACMIGQLCTQANHDPLINMMNRRGIEDKLNESLKALSTEQPLALAHLDLSSLKIVNDSYGYATGNGLLKQTSQRIESLLTKTQYFAGLGNGEFIILFQNCSIGSAEAASQRIIDNLLATPCRIGTRTFQARVSIGLIQITAHMEMQEALSAAARACSAAKKRNPHRVLVSEWNAQTEQEHLQDMCLMDELGRGFSPRRLFLEMQPIMSLQAPLDTLNFEVLIRMRDSNGSVIPATKIIAAAEESDTVSVLDKWVFSTTLHWLDAHQLRLPKTGFVCINLNGMSLNDESFTEEFFAVLAEFKHLSQMLCVEITESVALCDMENTRRFIKRLQTSGIRIALDDFGAGYASFSYLTELPTDAIKIDGALIKNMNKHPANIAVVEAIITLARNLGIRSIAEWVEDASTLEKLQDMGVDYVQGYAIARPQCPDYILQAENVGAFIADEQVRARVCAGSSTPQFQPLAYRREVHRL